MPWDTVTFDPAEDWSLWDGTEVASIGYYSYNPATHGYSDSATVAALFRQVSDDTESVTEGETTVESVAIHIKATEIEGAGIYPARLDVVQRFGVGSAQDIFYVVQRVDLATFGSRYKLATTKQKKSFTAPDVE